MPDTIPHDTTASDHEIEAYNAYDSEVTLADIRHTTNKGQFQAYSASQQGTGRLRKIGAVASTLFDYRRLLRALNKTGRVEFVTHRDLLLEDRKSRKVRVAIRHDIDTDIVGTMRMAQIEHEENAPTTWYVLHSAFYYRSLKADGNARHQCLLPWYRRLQRLGHEVGLHTDPLKLYQQLRIDGADAVVAELAWLREHGIEIVGTAAHNYAGAHGGAENYEIFRGYKERIQGHLPGFQHANEVYYSGRAFLHNPVVRSAEGRRVIPNSCDNAWAPLGVLDPEELGLRYEANEIWLPGRFPAGLVVYSIDAADSWWSSRWSMNNAVEKREQPMLDEQQIVAEIASLPANSFVVIMSHPCYHGHRHSPEQGPAMRRNALPTSHHDEIGWTTWTPGATVCWSGPADRPQEFQTIHEANELGMLDRSLEDAETKPPHDETRPEFRLLFLGADNLDGITVSKAAQCHRRIADLFDRYTQKTCRSIKLAYPGMGLDRLFGWYVRILERTRPDVVVLGIGDHSLWMNDPVWWAQATGVNPLHPSGDYLRPAPDGEIETIPASGVWRVHRTDPRDVDPALVTAEHDDPRWNAVEAVYAHAVGEITAQGARVVLLVESKGERQGFHHERRKERARKSWMKKLTRRLSEIAERVGTPIIDPYPAFEDLKPPVTAHYETDHRWTPVAHRLAAKMLFDHLDTASTEPPG